MMDQDKAQKMLASGLKAAYAQAKIVGIVKSLELTSADLDLMDELVEGAVEEDGSIDVESSFTVKGTEMLRAVMAYVKWVDENEDAIAAKNNYFKNWLTGQ